MTTPDGAIGSRVESVLSECLAARADALRPLGPDLEPLVQTVRTFVLDGGKRLRPRFAYWGWRSAARDAADDTALVSAAASLELLHASALVHDDVMDASATRRGRPATHVVFAGLHRDHGWTGNADAFGNAAAILVGDLLLGWSDALFAGAGVGAEARGVYDAMREHVMAGQYLDVLAQARGEFAADEALRVIEFKTSKYTVEGPLHLGAAIAGATPATIAALHAYGLALGEAFQLRDDVLGVFGDPAVTGKPAGDDLREGKRTLLTALAMESADAAQARVLRDGLGDPGLDLAGIRALRAVITDTGALDRVEDRITERATASRAALDSPHLAVDARAALDDLAATASQRRH